MARKKRKMDSLAPARITGFAELPPLQAHTRVERGISLNEAVQFGRTIALTQEELAGLLGVPTRTYQRWLAEPGRKLDPVTGGRYYRVLKIIQRAAALLGSMPAALEWLRSEQRALGYRVPFELIATEPGAEAVEDLLGRIEFGVVT